MMKLWGYRNLGVLAACAWLAGCASSTQTRPGVVHDAIQGEMKQALEARPAQPAPPPNLDLSLLPPLQTDGARPIPSQAVESRFDLSVQSAPAAQVFMGIVSGTPYSMLVGPDITGNITINLKNVTVREALEAIRELYGYEFRIQGYRISIQPNTLQTRVFKINYLAGRRQGTTDTRLTATSIASVGTSNTGTATSQTGNVTPTASGTGTGSAAAPGAMATSASGGARISTTIDADFWKEVSTALTAIVGTEEGRSVVLNAASGVIVVRGKPGDLRNVEAYLKATQLAVERQVMLEAKIIEVELDDAYQAGINWAAFRGAGTTRATFGSAGAGTLLQPSNGTVTTSASAAIASTGGALQDVNGTTAITGAAGALGTAATAGLTGLAFQTPNFAALMNFLETQGKLHVLSSPRIATLNNQKALLKVGNDEFFVTNVSTTTTTGTGATTTSPTVTLTPFFSGISLDVMPQIDENNNVILHVHPTVSSVTEKNKTINLGASGGSLVLPLAASTVNESDSIVRVENGYIAAIGGLMSQQQTASTSGLPGTVGTAMEQVAGQKSTSLRKRELVILLKPTIIRDHSDWQSDLEATQSRIDRIGQ